MGLKPLYSYPPQLEEIRVNGGILAENIEEALITNKDIKLVVVTSPTYEGAVSDIRAIAEVVHHHNALLLVDEAHGAHFGFHEGFPQSAICLGADLVIQSFHKTLPSFTQTAVLHSNRAELNHKIEQYLAIYQSSSPSYLLMAGMDRLVSMLEDNAKELFNNYYAKLEEFYLTLSALKNLKLLNRQIVGHYGIYELDPSKITISVRNTQLTGHQLQEMLREKYHIIMEMEASDYVLGMTSICDTKEGFERLAKALLVIDQDVAAIKEKKEAQAEHDRLPIVALQAMSPSEAWEHKSDRIALQQSIGRISATFVSLFPPGSPLIVPGEMIGEGLLDYIKNMQQEGITVTGLAGEQKDEIDVLK
jgi:arginine/lysine/ornithine decarboxylase